MITYKRNRPEISANIGNYNKYLNQMNFKGILEDDNIFNIDQESARDALNVYVDAHDHFVSRPTLQKDKTIDPRVKELVDDYQHKLVNIYNIGIGKLYITINTNNKYSAIIANDIEVTPIAGATYELTDLEKYHISIIEHYVICFNDNTNYGARVYDTNKPENGWQSLNRFIEIPVIKRVVGSTETTYDKNLFNENSYKEEYIWSNQSNPDLPAGDPDIVVNTNSKSLQWSNVPDMYVAPEYFTIRDLPINAKDGLVTSAKDRICIAYEDYFVYSLNDGKSFDKQYYPMYQGKYLNIASISKDGQYFFFVTSYAVYRCNLGTFEWAAPIRANSGLLADNTNYDKDIEYSGINNTCYFLNGDNFCFYTYDPDTASGNLYFKGLGLYSGPNGPVRDVDNNPVYKLNNISLTGIYFGSTSTDIDLSVNRLYMYSTLDSNKQIIMSIVYTYYSSPLHTSTFLTYLRGESYSTLGISNNSCIQRSTNISALYIGINKVIDRIAVVGTKIVVDLDITKGEELSDFWQDISATFEIYNESGQIISAYTEIESKSLFQQVSENGAIYKLYNAYLYNNRIVTEYDNVSYNIVLPNLLINNIYENVWENRVLTWLDGDHWYIVTNSGSIYTNNLLDDDIVSITYTHISNTNFTKVPNISYADTELYLAFDNLLQITANSRKGTDITFNLPPINDQSFIEQINGMINISTTEVAIFFIDKIVICAKTSDETLGYRYDYYNTKLSTGIRLGDSVINTLEGSYTVFPTKRGLALMNYQAFMATTDQIITYITDNIKHLWDRFFDESKSIKIIQWRNILILTNNTKEFLLYDISRNAWWRWQVPVSVEIALTDQINLKLINKTLLVFEDANKYYDFSKTNTIANGAKTINWFYQSQPLHFSAPNNYKNLKQLVFQFFDENETAYSKTILAQIKLFRKKITIREPETISFKIEDYRTFVKRFNYWKINELQWGLANDTETSTPTQLQLNAISVKYEIGEEVR